MYNHVKISDLVSIENFIKTARLTELYPKITVEKAATKIKKFYIDEGIISTYKIAGHTKEMLDKNDTVKLLTVKNSYPINLEKEYDFSVFQELLPLNDAVEYIRWGELFGYTTQHMALEKFGAFVTRKGKTPLLFIKGFGIQSFCIKSKLDELVILQNKEW